jgi:hypothetical protein
MQFDKSSIIINFGISVTDAIHPAIANDRTLCAKKCNNILLLM